MNGMTHIDGSYGSYLHPSVDMTHGLYFVGLGTYDIGSDRTASSIFLISSPYLYKLYEAAAGDS